MTAEDLCDWSQHTHFPEAIKYFLGNLEVYGVTRRFTFRFGVYAVVVMNIHRRCLRGLGKWLLVNQHLFVFPYRETSASLHLVLYCVAEGYASCGVTITGMKLAYGVLSL